MTYLIFLDSLIHASNGKVSVDTYLFWNDYMMKMNMESFDKVTTLLIEQGI